MTGDIIALIVIFACSAAALIALVIADYLKG
jgi:hypothetical protein